MKRFSVTVLALLTLTGCSSSDPQSEASAPVPPKATIGNYAGPMSSVFLVSEEQGPAIDGAVLIESEDDLNKYFAPSVGALSSFTVLSREGAVWVQYVGTTCEVPQDVTAELVNGVPRFELVERPGALKNCKWPKDRYGFVAVDE